MIENRPEIAVIRQDDFGVVREVLERVVDVKTHSHTTSFTITSTPVICQGI